MTAKEFFFKDVVDDQRWEIYSSGSSKSQYTGRAFWKILLKLEYFHFGTGKRHRLNYTSDVSVWYKDCGGRVQTSERAKTRRKRPSAPGVTKEWRQTRGERSADWINWADQTVYCAARALSLCSCGGWQTAAILENVSKEETEAAHSNGDNWIIREPSRGFPVHRHTTLLFRSPPERVGGSIQLKRIDDRSLRPTSHHNCCQQCLKFY